ncbi:MAG TPA: RNase adapter RapZ [Candidatus Acidoferrales bacterium]|nr:RNase adapter RapZ [Candidatus Acidoferrales bacterium]
MNFLEQLFEQHYGSRPTKMQPVQGGLGGSGRVIVRLSNTEHTAIGIQHDVAEENAAFLAFTRHFRKHGLPVPEIYAEDTANGVYLEEDLGDTTLFQFLSQNRQGADIAPEVITAYRRVVEVLPRFQVEAARDFDYSVCYPRSSFDRQSISWDLNYFKYYFLKLSGVPFHEQALEEDFEKLADLLLSAKRDYFLYRDFQSRNVMLRDGSPCFLDYQGGRRGALQYDIASLLFDAKAELPPEVRAQLLDHYLYALAEHIDVQRDGFLETYYAYVYVRILQALGAYGFRGFYERKAHFLQSVPYALRNLRWLMHNVKLPVELPALMSAFANMISSDKLQQIIAPVVKTEGLTVTVTSFSFHRGPVQDESGNGGGFVFDARSLPNPGREERFKKLCGRDAPVIEYLEAESAVHDYLAHAMTLVESSVKEYQRRGFTHLMISFGCTGGQHRSVYLAEQAAKRLAGRDGLRVVLRHREEEMWVR